MAVEYQCELCGVRKRVPASQYKRSVHHFCSAACRNRFYNAGKNKELMTPAVREKLRVARLGSGGATGYEKTYGRHTHRVVAEKILGRPLKKGEVVHHLDGNKRNNAPENLVVFSSQAEHAKWHADHKKEVTANGVHTQEAPADSG